MVFWFLWVPHLFFVVTRVSGFDDLCTRIQSSKSLTALTPNGDNLLLVVSEHVYSLPYAPSHIDSTNHRIYLYNRTSDFQELGHWTALPWITPFGIPSSSQLILLNMFHHPSTPQKKYAHVVYRTDGKTEDILLDVDDSKEVDPSYGQVEQLYGVVQDKAGRSSYVLKYRENSSSGSSQVSWSPNVVTLDANGVASINIPTSKAPGSLVPIIPFYYPTLSEDKSKVKFEPFSSDASRVLHVGQLPVFGFIFHEYIHLWDQESNLVLIFKDPGFSGTTISDQSISIEPVALVSIPMSEYLICGPEDTNQESGFPLWTILTGISILVLLLILGILWFRYQRKVKLKSKRTRTSSSVEQSRTTIAPGPLSIIQKSRVSDVQMSQTTITTRPKSESTYETSTTMNLEIDNFEDTKCNLKYKSKPTESSKSSSVSKSDLPAGSKKPSPRSETKTTFSREFSSISKQKQPTLKSASINMDNVPYRLSSMGIRPKNPNRVDSSKHTEPRSNSTFRDVNGKIKQHGTTEMNPRSEMLKQMSPPSMMSSLVGPTSTTPLSKVTKPKNVVQPLHPPSMFPSSITGPTSSVISDKAKVGLTTANSPKAQVPAGIKPRSVEVPDFTREAQKLFGSSLKVENKTTGQSTIGLQPTSLLTSKVLGPPSEVKSKIATKSTIGQQPASLLTSKVLAAPSQLFPSISSESASPKIKDHKSPHSSNNKKK